MEIPDNFILEKNPEYIFRGGDLYGYNSAIDKIPIDKVPGFLEGTKLKNNKYLFIYRPKYPAEIIRQMNIPEGYELNENLEHIIDNKDICCYTTLENPVFMQINAHFSWLGDTIKKAKSYYMAFHKSDILFASPCETKPRFKSDEPYPFGY